MISTRTKSHGILVSSRRGHTQPLGSMWTLPLSRQSSVPEALQLLAAAGADSVHAMALSGVPLPESPPARLSRKTARFPCSSGNQRGEAAAAGAVASGVPGRNPRPHPHAHATHVAREGGLAGADRGCAPAARSVPSIAAAAPGLGWLHSCSILHCMPCSSSAVCRDVVAPRTLKWQPSSTLMRLHFLVVLTTECSSRCQPHSCCNAPRDLVHMLRRQA